MKSIKTMDAAELFKEREELYSVINMKRAPWDYVSFNTIFEWQARICSIENELEERGLIVFEQRYY